MIKFPKYKENLRMIGDEVWSYSTNVAKREGNNLRVLGWWSRTTTKHVNYVANELGLTLIK
jgi:hypothetical protein